jgi:hypothetical protein
MSWNARRARLTSQACLGLAASPSASIGAN